MWEIFEQCWKYLEKNLGKFVEMLKKFLRKLVTRENFTNYFD